ncbi:MAG: NAD(P)/FAD-dependent oxidoreductase [Planctomycetota bacterium]
MSDNKFDLCVIGAGPAGFAAAMRAWDFGKRVAIVERGRLGGAGVHDGALSSKTFWELSRDYRRVLREDRGYRVKGVELDFDAVSRCVNEACGEKTEQLRRQLEALENANEEHAGSIEHFSGNAEFTDAHHVLLRSESQDDLTITADHFVIATGSRPRLLDSIAVDGERILTSDHVSSLRDFPESLVILGAGVVGCEFASIFANFGQTKVYLIDRADRILPFEDEDVAGVCARNLEAKGVTIHHGAQLQEMKSVGDHVEYTIQDKSGRSETIRVDRALISVGRVPNTESLGLANAGVELDQRSYIVSDDTRTRQTNIYAVGDVTYDIALVSVGEIEGRHAVERMFAGETVPLRYDNLSTIMFLDPEVAAVGLNETQAREQGISYRAAIYGYSVVPRAIAMRATDGFLKVLVSDDNDMRLLGVRALGVHASTTIESASLLISQGRSVRDLAEILHPHPAVTEGLQDCVRMLCGASVYKPHVFPELQVTRFQPEVS